MFVMSWWPSEPLTHIEGYLFYVFGGRQGGLCGIKNHLCEGQTKTGKKKYKFVTKRVCVFLCVCVYEMLSRLSSVHVCVCAYKQHREDNADDLHGALLIHLLLILPLFSLSFVLLHPLLLNSSLPSLSGVHPKVNVWKKRTKIIYSLFESKILTPALTRYPRAAKLCVCQSRFDPFF